MNRIRKKVIWIQKEGYMNTGRKGQRYMKRENKKKEDRF